MSKAELRELSQRLVAEYVEQGGQIVVGKPSHKASNSTYRFIRADVAYRGAKSKSLRMSGLSKATG